MDERSVIVPKGKDGVVDVPALATLVRGLLKTSQGLKRLKERFTEDMIVNYLIESEEGKSTREGANGPAQARLSRKQTQDFAELLMGHLEVLETEEE